MRKDKNRDCDIQWFDPRICKAFQQTLYRREIVHMRNEMVWKAVGKAAAADWLHLTNDPHLSLYLYISLSRSCDVNSCAKFHADRFTDFGVARVLQHRMSHIHSKILQPCFQSLNLSAVIHRWRLTNSRIDAVIKRAIDAYN